MEHQTNAPLANSIPDVCRRLGLGRTTVYALIGDGQLKSFQIGARRLVSETSLLEFLAKNEKTAA